MPQGSVWLVKDGLEPRVKFLALGKQIVQLDFAQNRSQSGLRQLFDGISVVLQLHNRLLRADHPKENDSIHFHGNIITGNDILRRHIPGHSRKETRTILSMGQKIKISPGPFIRLPHPSQAEGRPPAHIPATH